MTLLDLIRALEKFLDEHPDAGEQLVYMEGCDCDGVAGSVTQCWDNTETAWIKRAVK